MRAIVKTAIFDFLLFSWHSIFFLLNYGYTSHKQTKKQNRKIKHFKAYQNRSNVLPTIAMKIAISITQPNYKKNCYSRPIVCYFLVNDMGEMVWTKKCDRAKEGGQKIPLCKWCTFWIAPYWLKFQLHIISTTSEIEGWSITLIVCCRFIHT